MSDHWHENLHLNGLAYTYTALDSPRARAACHEAITCLSASREWGMLSIMLVGVTSWFAANGNPTAAAITAGYLQRTDVFWNDIDGRLEELGIDRDPAAAAWLAREEEWTAPRSCSTCSASSRMPDGRSDNG